MTEFKDGENPTYPVIEKILAILILGVKRVTKLDRGAIATRGNRYKISIFLTIGCIIKVAGEEMGFS